MGKLRDVFQKLDANGFVPVFAMMVAIQGTVIIGQLVAALLLSPAQLGFIRAIESALAVLVLVGSVGTQTLAIRDTAEEPAPELRMIRLRNLYLVTGLGCLTVLLGLLIARAILPPSVILDTVAMSSGIVLLSNLVRATTGFSQGAGLAQVYYRTLVGLSLLSILAQALFSNLWGVQGWVIARYVGEGACLAGLMAITAKVTPGVPWAHPIDLQALWRTIRQGLAVNSALVLRLLADSLPILALAAFRVPTDQIGFFGLASLTLVAVTLPLAVFAQRAIPLLIASSGSSRDHALMVRRLYRQMLLTSATGAAILSLGALAADRWVQSEYSPAFHIAAGLAWVLPVKAMALAAGTILVVARRYTASMWVNALELGIVAITSATAIPSYGADGAVLCVWIGSAVSAALLCLIATGETFRLRA